MDDFIQVFDQPHVSLTGDPISSVNETGIVANGKQYEVDVRF